MSGFDEAYAAIRGELAATPGKRVLLVEGTGDVEFLTFLLDKPPLRERNVHADWVIGAAGGKDSVVRMLERQPGWIGLVDRDAWSEQDILKAEKKTPNLRLLPRYCIENYLVDAAALEALTARAEGPARQRAQRALREIEAQWPDAVRHGSLWRAIQPLQDQLQALGFNGALLRFQLPDDAQVRRVLADWSALMDDQRIYGEYQRFQAQAEAMPAEKARRLWAHGKMFWRHVVAPALGEALDEPNESRLRRLTQRRMPLPEDLRALLDRIFLFTNA